jgi:hypothetical protein
MMNGIVHQVSCVDRIHVLVLDLCKHIPEFLDISTDLVGTPFGAQAGADENACSEAKAKDDRQPDLILGVLLSGH